MDMRYLPFAVKLMEPCNSSMCGRERDDFPSTLYCCCLREVLIFFWCTLLFSAGVNLFQSYVH